MLQRGLVLGIVAAGMIGPSSNAQLSGETRNWWSPSSSPVSGAFSQNANWQGFLLPITDGSRVNFLTFDFAAPTDFLADNNLQSNLLTGTLRFLDPGINVRLIGQPLLFQSYRSGGSVVNDPRIDIRGRVTLETPLRGTRPLTFDMDNGQLVLNPNNLATHDYSGGFIIDGATASGVLEVSRGAALGGINNVLTLLQDGNGPFGTVRADGGTVVMD